MRKKYGGELNLCKLIHQDREGLGNGRMPELYEMCRVNQTRVLEAKNEREAEGMGICTVPWKDGNLEEQWKSQPVCCVGFEF